MAPVLMLTLSSLVPLALFNGQQANEQNYAEDIKSNVTQWRNAIAILSWCCFGLFTFICLVYIGKVGLGERRRAFISQRERAWGGSSRRSSPCPATCLAAIATLR
jgi:hypothetical protein